MADGSKSSKISEKPAAIAYIKGYNHNTSKGVNADLANWQVFAHIFKGASIYE
ncbi:hypothetical protein SAMN04487996_102349 [Dyadobacter soli]|uniref:DUF7660 domain-containing protein n=1 Tax=Dyadobacter soli TaxID=659014 RepID=A0A1G6Y548_9BACT|nr:hypothetical protein SAMN04487996_102349 [Dyadobacter soli]